MINRYNLEVVKKGNKKVYPIQAIPAELDLTDYQVVTIRATAMDRLDRVAYKYYKDAALWWVIASANGIVGTMYPTPGQLLRIPTDIQRVIVDIERLAK